MRQDLRPLCNEHYSEMAKANRVVHKSASEAEIPVHACTRQACTRLYDTHLGYYDFTTGKCDSPHTCDEHQVKLYVNSYNRQSKTQVWQCPTEGCTRIETVESAP